MKAYKKLRLGKVLVFMLFLLFYVPLSSLSKMEKGKNFIRPTGLTVNFLLLPDRVFLNGYRNYDTVTVSIDFEYKRIIKKVNHEKL